MVVLGVVCSDGSYVGAPDKRTVIEPGDTVVVYGRAHAVAAIGARSAGPGGDVAHRNRVTEEQRGTAEERTTGRGSPGA